jgi:hypothetical protein
VSHGSSKPIIAVIALHFKRVETHSCTGVGSLKGAWGLLDAKKQLVQVPFVLQIRGGFEELVQVEKPDV